MGLYMFMPLCLSTYMCISVCMCIADSVTILPLSCNVDIDTYMYIQVYFSVEYFFALIHHYNNYIHDNNVCEHSQAIKSWNEHFCENIKTEKLYKFQFYDCERNLLLYIYMVCTLSACMLLCLCV